MLSREEIKLLLLCSNRSGNLFSSLPKEIIIQRIGGINVEQAYKCVIDTDYKGLAAILNIDPLLMFATLTTKKTHMEIITKLLNYVFEILDKTAWELCFIICEKNLKKYPDMMRLYLQVAQETNNYVNLQTIFDAYQNYSEQFDQYRAEKIDQATLLRFLLKIGEEQAQTLPRHMLRDMCRLPVRLQIATQDLVLINVDADLDITILNKLTKQYSFCPVLVNSFARLGFYQFYQYDFFYENWVCHQIEKLPCTINFPKELNHSVFKSGEYNNQLEKLDYSIEDYLPWRTMENFTDDDHQAACQEAVFMNTVGIFKRLWQTSEMSKLGVDFTLVRGASGMCFAVDQPAGHYNYLKHKTNDDLNSFKALREKRITQKDELVAKLKTTYKFTLIEDFKKENKHDDINDEAKYKMDKKNI